MLVAGPVLGCGRLRRSKRRSSVTRTSSRAPRRRHPKCVDAAGRGKLRDFPAGRRFPAEARLLRGFPRGPRLLRCSVDGRADSCSEAEDYSLFLGTWITDFTTSYHDCIKGSAPSPTMVTGRMLNHPEAPLSGPRDHRQRVGPLTGRSTARRRARSRSRACLGRTSSRQPRLLSSGYIPPVPDHGEFGIKGKWLRPSPSVRLPNAHRGRIRMYEK